MSSLRESAEARGHSPKLFGHVRSFFSEVQMTVPTSEQPGHSQAPIPVSPPLRLKREILGGAFFGILFVGGLTYSWTDDIMLRIASLAGHPEWSPPPIVRIELILLAGLVGASAGAGLGAPVFVPRGRGLARSM